MRSRIVGCAEGFLNLVLKRAHEFSVTFLKVVLNVINAFSCQFHSISGVKLND
jgi:hypothetical protein